MTSEKTMTLEDFFTLTEMKDGLTATSRVEELIAGMQKEKDSFVNPGDAIRQWAAVAGVVAATDNKDCLNLFVQLGGICFIDRWLKDVWKFGGNNGGNFVDESIIALLLALEKLCIDKDISVSSGIWVTVSQLLDHTNVKVRDRARAVVDNWNRGGSDVEGVGPVNDGISDIEDVGGVIGEMECSSTIPSGEEKEIVQGCASEAVKADDLPSQSSNDTDLERLDDAQRKRMAPGTSGCTQDHLLSSHVAAGDCQEGPFDDAMDVQMCGTESTKGEACETYVPQSGSLGATVSEPGNEIPEGKKPVHEPSSGQDNSSSLGATNALEHACISSDTDALISEEIAAVSPVDMKMDIDEGNCSTEVAAISDLQASATEHQVQTIDALKFVEENGCCPEGDKLASEKLDNLDDPLPSKEANAARDRLKEVSNLSALYGGRKGKKRSKKARGKKSAIELEYGIVDALDIARQVAKEVEREVIDYKEPFGSTSSERSSGGVFGRGRSPDSINGNISSSVDSSSDDSSTEQSQSAEVDGRRSTGNGDSKTNDPMEDVSSSRMSEAKVKADKGFDLNEEVCLDDGGDEEPRDTSSQKLKGLEIDLNTAEDGEDASVFPVTGNHVPLSSSIDSKGLPRDDYQGRFGRFDLDLNSAGGDDDDDVIICDTQQLAGRIFLPPASSSLQTQHNGMNFDLNDQPCSSSREHFSDWAPYRNLPSSVEISLGKPGRPVMDPFISIMGTKVDVGRGGLVPPRSLDLSNGKATLEPSSGSSLGLGPAFPSLYTPLSRCSNLPTGHTISFSPYGPSEPIHYMVDPRVGPTVTGAPGPGPGPGQALYSPYSMPFAMSLNAGPSQPQYDMNSRFAVDGANREPGFLMQLFPPSQVKSPAEHSNALLQPLFSSVPGGKRKEPEGGRDSYPINYGQYQSPWK